MGTYTGWRWRGQHDLYNGKKFAGDTIWACGYDPDGHIFGVQVIQEPVFGMLAMGRTQADHEAEMAHILPSAPNTCRAARFFVPFGKKGNPLWGRAVKLYHRIYADTEKESRALYDSMCLDCAARYLGCAFNAADHALNRNSEAYHRITSWSMNSSGLLPEAQTDITEFLEGVTTPYQDG